MDLVISTNHLHKVVKIISDVMHKGESLSKTYYKAWSVLIRYDYLNHLPKTYQSEYKAMVNAKIMNENGIINWQVANGVIMDEL